MDQLIRATSEIDVSHIDASRVRCSRQHGHRLTVTVEKRLTSDPADLEVALHSVLAEWQDRDVNEMLHVTSVSLVQLAAWVTERLLLIHPTIERVEVSDGRLTGIVRQEAPR